MLQSLALIFLSGLAMGALFEKLHLPRFLGMIVAGLVLGSLQLLDPELLKIVPDLKEIALIIILMRAGLSLNVKDLINIGRPAIMMCFIPASCEMVGFVLLAPLLLGVSTLEAAIMGATLAAVSPAVVIPRMLKLMQDGVGARRGIPQLLMAGASVDDVYVIVMFTMFVGLGSGEGAALGSLLKVPVSIAIGVACGIAGGWLLTRGLRRWPATNTVKVILLLALSFVFIALEQYVMIAGLLAVMSMGATILALEADLAKMMSDKFAHLWVAAEILLFTLVGAGVDLSYVAAAGGAAVALIFAALVFRSAGVLLCTLATPFSAKERLFCVLAYTPKATVQAALGSVPLSMGLSCGSIVLTVAVLAILITAPMGAILIDKTYKRLLEGADQAPVRLAGHR